MYLKIKVVGGIGCKVLVEDLFVLDLTPWVMNKTSGFLLPPC